MFEHCVGEIEFHEKECTSRFDILSGFEPRMADTTGRIAECVTRLTHLSEGEAEYWLDSLFLELDTVIEQHLRDAAKGIDL